MEQDQLIAVRYEALQGILDERQVRLWAAAEARALGRGGIAAVSRTTGLSRHRIARGLLELEELEQQGEQAEPIRQQGGYRVRMPGAGRKRIIEQDPTVLSDLESLVDPVTRGDPESALRWTSKSTEKLAEELQAKGHRISPRTVYTLLKDHLEYRLNASAKTIERNQHPDRNEQFEFINEQAQWFMAHGLPVISVDTKKKELIGQYKNAGREWELKGKPTKVLTHDFRDPSVPKAVPYGVYDTGLNEGYVGVGIDGDTSSLAVDTIEQWWRMMGHASYPNADEILITADAGGSNGYRTRLWKLELQRFADRTGLTVNVSHFPPGTSKWNKIEHRMFSHIFLNWRGRPLTTHEAVVDLIGATTTTTGLKIQAKLNRGSYPTGIRVPDKTMKTLNIASDDFHGEWNYSLSPHPH